MNIKPQINQLYYSDEQLFFKITSLLRNTYAQKLSQFFIYTDDNYLNYLKILTLNKHDFWIYYCINTETNDFLGFAIFRKVNSNLFLNQLIIDPKFQHSGLGSFLLMGSLQNLLNAYGKGYFKYFEIETFSSNEFALAWFNKLGMKISDISNWYKLTSDDIQCNNYKNAGSNKVNHEFELIPDDNGFTQLYYNKKHMGTVINKQYVLIKFENISYLDEILPYLFCDLSIKAVCINSRSETDLPLLDKCLLFRAPFSKIIKSNIS